MSRRKISQNFVFHQIRTLPIEVQFSQVEMWVNDAIDKKKTKQQNKWLNTLHQLKDKLFFFSDN